MGVREGSAHADLASRGLGFSKRWDCWMARATDDRQSTVARNTTSCSGRGRLFSSSSDSYATPSYFRRGRRRLLLLLLKIIIPLKP